MGKNLLVGVGSKARKVKALYVGVGGKARKVKKVYVGVGGKARLVYTSYVAVSSIDLVLPDDTKQLTVTITAKFTPNDATNKKVTWEFGSNLGYIKIVSTTDTSCILKVTNASMNSYLYITATASNGVTVKKRLMHTGPDLLNKSGVWRWD